jgi:hypothetical protein
VLKALKAVKARALQARPQGLGDGLGGFGEDLGELGDGLGWSVYVYVIWYATPLT